MIKRTRTQAKPTYAECVDASTETLQAWTEYADNEWAEEAQRWIDNRNEAKTKDGGIDRPKYPPKVP